MVAVASGEAAIANPAKAVPLVRSHPGWDGRHDTTTSRGSR